MDVSRATWTARFKFWSDSEELSGVRWWFADPEAPAIPFPHVFTHIAAWDDQPASVPQPGQAGEVPRSGRFDPGTPPPVLPANPGGHFMGSVRQWQEGSVAGDPPLTPTAAGFSVECLAALGVSLTVRAMVRPRDPFSGFETVG